ncbi:MAG: hypothetical protein WDN66_00240 [Candidatus Saccharibacteria bacterium]
MEKGTILIASSSESSQEYKPVVEKLESNGHAVVVYNSDLVIKGKENFYLGISPNGSLGINYEGHSIEPESVSAAWFRKVSNFSFEDRTDDKALQIMVHEEVDDFHRTIWSLYPEDTWLNSPSRMQAASSKLMQLLVANQVGFSIPETVLSNSWESIGQKLFSDEGYRQIIVKMIRGVIVMDNEAKALPTTVLNEESVSKLKELATAFPGIYQPFIPKAREWRVTVVGDDVFPVAIYSDASAKDDWRIHQQTEAIRFSAEELPEAEQAMCIEFLDKMQLGFGAFDFIETPEGEVVFLECNANGQYYWLENQLGIPVSSSIAKRLMTISDES